MSLRELVDPECGGANPLMRLGNHIIHDAAHKDEGISGRPPASALIGQPQFPQQQQLDETSLVNEFLGQMAPMPPQTFHMDALLQEMREIDAQNFAPQVLRAPAVAEEINKNSSMWANEFTSESLKFQPNQKTDEPAILQLNEQVWQSGQQHQPGVEANGYITQNAVTLTKEFFDNENVENLVAHDEAGAIANDPDKLKYTEFVRFMKNVDDTEAKLQESHPAGNIWADEFSAIDSKLTTDGTSDWVKDFAESKQTGDVENEKFNKRFWNRLQDEWRRLSQESEDQPPWLSEFSEYYDPYKEYTFDEDNPMLNTSDALEKGKQFLHHGDVPSAVLCFESAVRNDMDNAEIWELLGTSQAENEKDPNAIAALKRSLELRPNNRNVLMALAISYTNESLQNQALRMLIDWLRCNEKYQHIVPESFKNNDNAAIASSLINGPELEDVQNLYLQAVQQSPEVVDHEIQEALGVLFNLSGEYEKAADCFQAAVQAKPDSAKLWNRLGASLANGNKAVEAVDAYQHALAIEPGYIRARYNVGIICINLKAYNEAVEHFLLALNHQAESMARSGLRNANSNNQMSDTIWSTLRMAISLMGKPELQEAIDQKDLATLNNAFKTKE